MGAIFILACSIVWLLLTMGVRILSPLTLSGWVLALWPLLLLLYLFLVLYTPNKQNMDMDIQKAKQDYFDNKDKLDPIYADQLKRKWEDDIATRNKYYIGMFVLWCYMPIPFYAIYLLYPTAKQFTLDNYVPEAGLALVLTCIITTLLWAGYTFGFFQAAYVIIGVLVGLAFMGVYIYTLMKVTMNQRILFSLALYVTSLLVVGFVYGTWTAVFVCMLIAIISVIVVVCATMIGTFIPPFALWFLLFVVFAAMIVWGTYTFGLVVAACTLILFGFLACPVIATLASKN